MPRARSGPQTKRRRKRWLSAARGYFGGRSKLYKSARQQVVRGLISAHRERRRKKRTFRSLMIARINAGLEGHDLNYSRFVHGLKLAGVTVDRSVLSELAVQAPEDFRRLVETAAEALKAPAAEAS
ncbi:MAG: 50S ribosomal protein L20 [candidate division WOR-3 bacterium]|nr:MAG: 50S ribosomal protein L20 [candidate division WOR-3 bacterium]